MAQRNHPSTRYTNPRTLPSHPAPSTPSSTRQPAQPVISTTTASATQPRTWSSSDEISLRESCLSNVLGWKPDYVHKDDLVTFLLAHWKARPVNPTEADIKEYIELSLKSHHATPIQLRRTLQKSLDMKLIRPTVSSCSRSIAYASNQDPFSLDLDQAKRSIATCVHSEDTG